MITPPIREAAAGLAAAAVRRVQEPATGRVRVEDYLTVLAAATGEAAIVASGAFDIESADLPPGGPVFGDPVNLVLSGDTAELAAVGPDTVVGILAGELVPSVVPGNAFGSLERLYRHVAEHVGAAPWGAVSLTVPPDNVPSVLPLQVAFEIRPDVEAAAASCNLPASRRHVVCAVALGDALRQVRDAIDMQIALTLVLEVVFGMAKVVPMSRRAFDAAASSGRESPGA